MAVMFITCLLAYSYNHGYKRNRLYMFLGYLVLISSPLSMIDMMTVNRILTKKIKIFTITIIFVDQQHQKFRNELELKG